MSAHETTPGEAHAPHAPPGIPEVHDEAGDTPAWMPLLGAAVFAVLIGIVLLLR